jgi:hypothetical protein
MPQQAVNSKQLGIFDRTKADNHFKSHTVVHISYCSGDVFGGNVTRPYTDKLGKPIQQKGLSNVQSALDWVKAQQTSGKLSRTQSELVIGGASAGSVGAQLWASNGEFPSIIKMSVETIIFIYLF